MKVPGNASAATVYPPLRPGEPRRMYISNIAPTATDEEIRALVRDIVPYRRIRVIRNIRHGLCARFAFVDIEPDREQDFIARLDGFVFFGRHLGVLRVLSRPDRPGPDGV